MVNLFTKHSIMQIARKELGAKVETPKDQAAWAALAARLEIQVIQISERDTQQSSIKRRFDEFTCTWCVSAMMDESSEHSQVPLGTHEDQSTPITNRPGSHVVLDPGAPPTWFSENMSGLK